MVMTCNNPTCDRREADNLVLGVAAIGLCWLLHLILSFAMAVVTVIQTVQMSLPST